MTAIRLWGIRFNERSRGSLVRRVGLPVALIAVYLLAFECSREGRNEQGWGY